MPRANAGLMAAAVALSVLTGMSRADQSTGAKPAVNTTQPLVWTDLDGRGYSPVQLRANAATVFVFFSTQCAASNAYMARVHALEQSLFSKRVRFFLVNDHGPDTPEILRRYAEERHLAAPIVKDADCALAERLQVKVTSEVAVVDREGNIRYRGPIDDNKSADLVRAHYLAEALDKVIAGQPVPQPWPKAAGCIIEPVKAPTRFARAVVTYARDVAPILNKQCVDCHRPGEVAPFPLLTYADARVWARQIKDVTQRRVMPPWKAEPGYGDFHNARTLTQAERSVLSRWADAGAPAGDLTAAPKPPAFPGEWPLGKPDVILHPAGSFHVPADARDIYRCFILPLKIKANTYIDFSQIRPDNRSVVHHVIVYADPTGKAAKLAANDPQLSFENPRAGAGPPVPGSYPIAGWAPGGRPSPSPRGLALPVPKGAQLVMEVHYHPSGRPEADKTAVGITFARGEITKLWNGGIVVQPNLALEPGNKQISVSARTKMTEDVTLYNIGPHMHQIGKEMHVWAVTPENKRIELIWLKDWDFNWQTDYDYREPIKIPKGTKIEMTAVFDNSESNPRNPNRPPKMVAWGEQTTDEMCIAFLSFTNDAEKLHLPAPPWEQCVEVIQSEKDGN